MSVRIHGTGHALSGNGQPRHVITELLFAGGRHANAGGAIHQRADCMLELVRFRPCHWMSALAQNTLMLRVLKGEGFSASHVGVPLPLCGLLTVGSLRGAAVR